MRICFIYNQQAGSSEKVGLILKHLDGRHRYELCPTTKERSAEQIAADALTEGFDRIVAMGGDGTLSSVVNGIAPRFGDIEVGLIPVGTGNDFARMLNLSADALDVACQRAIQGTAHGVDVLKMTLNDQPARYCINVANGGFSGRIAANIKAEDKKKWGPMAYWISSISNLISMDSYEVALSSDDQPEKVVKKVICVAVANGRFVGGGFPIAPLAKVDDGFIDITVIPELPMVELMVSGLQHFSGGKAHNTRIQSYKAKKVRISAKPDLPFSIDGEVARPMDAQFECLPRALPFAGFSHELVPKMEITHNTPTGTLR